MSDASPVRYRFGAFELDAVEGELRHKRVLVPLTAKAIELLLILVTHAGQTQTKSDLMRALWPDTAVEEGSLSQTVFLLRKALGDDPEGSSYIVTIPKRGYKFVAPVEAANSPSAQFLRPETASGKGSWTVLGGIVVVALLGVVGWIIDRRWRCRCVRCETRGCE